MSVSSDKKVKLKISPARLVMVKSLLVALGKVMLANTVSTLILSVTLTVMLVLCVWLKRLGSAVKLMTSGGVLSSTVKLVVSVLFTFPEVSLAMMVRLYTPIGAVSPGTNEKLKMSPTRLVRVNKTLLPSALVMLANTVSTPMLSVTLTVMLVISVWLMMLGSTVKLMTSGRVISNTVKLVVSVLLMFPAVSLASIVTLYSPGMSVSSGTKVKLKISPTRLVIVKILLVAVGKVMFTNTVSTFVVMSVTLAVILVLCV